MIARERGELTAICNNFCDFGLLAILFFDFEELDNVVYRGIMNDK